MSPTKPIISMSDFRNQDQAEVSDLNSLIISAHAMLGNTKSVPEYHKRNLDHNIQAILKSANERIQELLSVAFTAKSSKRLSGMLK